MKTNNINIKFAHEDHKASYCIIETPDGEVYKGVAKLHYKDTFCKDKGRKESMKRALRKAGFSKEQRAEVWEAYRLMTKEPRWSKKTKLAEV
ncbi:MAG: hypothetical protein ACOCV1_04075 [Bacillota bacterium]